MEFGFGSLDFGDQPPNVAPLDPNPYTRNAKQHTLNRSGKRRTLSRTTYRIHLIIEMILVDRPCAMGVLNSLFQVALYLPSSERDYVPALRRFPQLILTQLQIEKAWQRRAPLQGQWPSCTM